MIIMIILTADERHYRVGEVIESRGVKYPPTKPKTTYIVHMNKISEKEITNWLGLVSYRMVFVVDKLPKLSKQTKEEIIIDKSLGGESSNFNIQIGAMMKWTARTRAKSYIEQIPIPLALAFVRQNQKSDMKLWRMLGDATFVLPEKYIYALLTYGVKPLRSFAYPQKKAKREEIPNTFSKNEVYWEQITKLDGEVRNEIRRNAPEEIPKGVKKRQEKVFKWV